MRSVAAALLLVTLPWAAADEEGLHRLVAAYPEQFAASDKPNTLVWRDGTETAYDDGNVKPDFEDRLARANPKDQMSIAYPCGWPMREPGENEDPGRFRCAAIFGKMYGDSATAVKRNLTPVPWPAAGVGATVSFTRVNGAAAALEQAGKEIAALPEETRRYAAKPAGTFNWRVVAGEDRPSPHSYGIAIDFQLPAPLYRYWRWDAKGGGAVPAYPAAVPRDGHLGQIVQIFERHGFVWGGKWRHYDTMHFEYRPELAVPAR